MLSILNWINNLLSQYSAVINLFTAIATSFLAWFFAIDKMIDKGSRWLGFFCRIIKVYPVNEMGENKFRLDKSDDPTKTERFSVEICCNLWVKYKLEIINIDLAYIENASLSSKNVKINNKPVSTDKSFRMCNFVIVQDCESVNIRLFQRFVCKYDEARDYGVVTIKLEAASSLWVGIKLILITGRLSAGGELSNIQVKNL
ncbi:MAG TPA: hypothetical protein VFU82_03630 [Gammaproteobacteria bacterium]|jgi:hypothetical protein|nr:hypothetical protein [Gammaproteobacteria bacterium]